MELTGAVLATRGDDVVLEAYGGVADPTTGARCGPRSRFQIASLSKQFAAAAVLLLVEDGVLALTDRLSDRLTDCPAAWADITLHHLLTHTSGLPHWDGIPDFDFDTPPPLAESVARITRCTPLTEPGHRWHYSSVGYVLTALVVERASGSGYQDFLRERVIRPLGLVGTGVGAAPPADVARGRRAGQTYDFQDLTTMPGTGDVWSTARDLARWARALERGALLAPDSLRAMFTTHFRQHQQRPPLTVTGYGYGVFLGDLAGRPARFHDGHNIGYRSLLVRLPEQDASIVVLANDDDADPYASVPDVARALGLKP